MRLALITRTGPTNIPGRSGGYEQRRRRPRLHCAQQRRRRSALWAISGPLSNVGPRRCGSPAHRIYDTLAYLGYVDDDFEEAGRLWEQAYRGIPGGG